MDTTECVWGKVLGLMLLLQPLVLEANGQPYTRLHLHGSDSDVDEFNTCCGAPCYKENGPNYYRYLVTSTRDPSILYVGAMNFLFKLNTSDLSCVNKRKIEPASDVFNRCTLQGKSSELDCQNHIRVIMEMKADKLYVCGTGAYSPLKFEIDETSLNLTESSAGYGICPFDPLDNATAILIDNGNPGGQTVPYFGTYTDFIKNWPMFYRPSYKTEDGTTYSEKGTDREDINWLNLPQFVGSFDEEKEVYTFFRETAVEYPASKNKIYSRVAKVCKGDLGGGYMSKKKWLSFQKARLNCSFPGSAPYDFDEIYDIYRSGDLYFGLFYKQGADLNASAICVFRKADIEAAFVGKFKYKNTADHWVTLPDNLNPNPRLDNCTAHDTTPQIFNDKVSQYQLMDTNVDSVHKRPIYYKHGVQLMRLVVSQEKNGSRNIYAASDEGDVHDIFMKSFANKEPTVVLNAVYDPFETDHPIWTMKQKDSDIFLGTDYQVGKLKLDKICSKLDKIDSCILNTRCKWCRTDSRCKPVSDSSCSEALDHNVVEAGQPLLKTLEGRRYIHESLEVTISAISGSYSRLDISPVYRVSDVVWNRNTTASGSRKKRSVNKQNILEENADKFAMSATGDLIIRNVTKEDSGLYQAYSPQSDKVIAQYRLTVRDQSNEQEIIEVWKQQFNEWSSAFSVWKKCSEGYFNSCEASSP